MHKLFYGTENLFFSCERNNGENMAKEMFNKKIFL